MFDIDDESDFEPELPSAPPAISDASLTTLYTNLVRLFDGTEWVDYEPETIQLHLGYKLDDLALDKIEVLRNIVSDEDVLNVSSFVLHAIDVVNGSVADFDHVPVPTSLELAWYVVSIKSLMDAMGSKYTPSSALKSITLYTLRDEGYSEPVEPFSYVDKSMLTPGQTETDTAAKRQAVEQYIAHMESL